MTNSTLLEDLWGLLKMWDRCCLKSIEVLKSCHFLINIGHYVGIQGTTVFANIYGPRALPDKLKLWEILMNIMTAKPGTWIMFGDFNVVRSPNERINSQ